MTPPEMELGALDPAAPSAVIGLLPYPETSNSEIGSNVAAAPKAESY